MSVDLAGLGPQGFEEMCRALGVRILGPGVTAFGAGPDGGREASLSGLQQFPNTAAPWNGYGIMQAKYKAQLRGTRTDTTWLRGRIKAELDAWADPAKRRVRDGRRPEYLIVTTNVALSGVPGSGGKDRIDELIKQYAADLGLRDWSIWDAPQIVTFPVRCGTVIRVQAMRAAVACAWIMPFSISRPRPLQTGLAHAVRRLASLTPARRVAAGG